MKINKEITITLGEDDVKEIIADYLRKEDYYVTAKDVELNVGVECRGYGPMEHDEVVFRNCTVKVPMEKAKT